MTLLSQYYLPNYFITDISYSTTQLSNGMTIDWAFNCLNHLNCFHSFYCPLCSSRSRIRSFLLFTFHILPLFWDLLVCHKFACFLGYFWHLTEWWKSTAPREFYRFYIACGPPFILHEWTHFLEKCQLCLMLGL